MYIYISVCTRRCSTRRVRCRLYSHSARYVPVWFDVYLSIYLYLHLSIYLFIYIYICVYKAVFDQVVSSKPTDALSALISLEKVCSCLIRSIYLSTYLYLHLSIYLSISVSISVYTRRCSTRFSLTNPPTRCRLYSHSARCVPVRFDLSIYRSIYLSIYICIYLSMYIYICVYKAMLDEVISSKPTDALPALISLGKVRSC